MNYTPNFKLPTWALSDRIQMQDFNDMTAKLDAALKAEETARSSAVTTLSQAMTQRGNCQVYTYTYHGTGTYGADNPTVIPIPKLPYLLLIFNNVDQMHALTPQTRQMDFLLYNGHAYGYLTWSDTSLSIYSPTDAIYQLNHGNAEYYAMAFYLANGT